MKKILLLLILFITITAKAQMGYTPGYYITKSGDKVEGFIKSSNTNYGDQILFKKTLDGNLRNLKAGEIISFSTVESGENYVVFNVDWDSSSDLIKDMKKVRNPVLVNKTLFLKEEISQDKGIGLYSYKDETKSRLFIVNSAGKIEQLIYKKFIIPDSGSDIGYNNYYKQQLLNTLECSLIDKKDIERTTMAIKDIRELITINNACASDFDYNDVKPEHKGAFRISVRPGLKFSTLSIESKSLTIREAEFDPATSYRLGVELEYILNKYNYNWSFIVEPSYHQFENMTTITADNVTSDIDVEYSTVELTLGTRYYVNVSDNIKPYADFSLVLSLFENGNIDYSNFQDLPVRSNLTAVLGAGFSLFDHYVVQFQYQPRKNLSSSDGAYATNYANANFIIGYKF